jgi:hypothetical protein
LYQWVLALRPAKAEPLLPVPRCRRRGSPRGRGGRGWQALEAEVGHEDGDGGEAEDDEREDEQVEHGHLDVVGFDFLAEVLGGSTDHEAGDEDGDDDEDQHAVEAGADAAEDDFAEQMLVRGPGRRGG